MDINRALELQLESQRALDFLRKSGYINKRHADKCQVNINKGVKVVE